LELLAQLLVDVVIGVVNALLANGVGFGNAVVEWGMLDYFRLGRRILARHRLLFLHLNYILANILESLIQFEVDQIYMLLSRKSV
jgi:hypothetical protein